MTTGTPAATGKKNNHTKPLDARIVWNDKQILAAAGSTPAGVIAILSEHKQPLPTPTAVYQWLHRRNIPDHWRAPLVYALLHAKKLPLGSVFAVRTPPSETKAAA